MALISLNNGTQQTGRFTCNFKESITIPENSKIALLNASIAVEDTVILVSPNNNTFAYKTSSSTTNLTTTLTPNLYNISGFLNEITKQMNTVLKYENTTDRKTNRGFQCKATVSDERRLQISTALTGTQEPKLWTQKFRNSLTKTGNNYSKSSADGWDAGSCSEKYFINGCGVFYSAMDNVETQFFCLGLTDSNILSDYEDGAGSYDFSPSKYTFAIYNEAGTGATVVYYVKILDEFGNSLSIESDIPCTDNDIVGIALEEGSLKFFAIPTGNPIDHATINAHLISSTLDGFTGIIDWEYDTSYYGMFSAYTNGFTFTEPRMHYDPYHKITTDIVKYPHFKEGNQYELDPNESFNGLGASIMSLILPEAVQKLFGFTSNPLPSPSATMHTFEAQKTLQGGVIPSNIKIVVENMRLDSYNSKTQKRESILMTIPTIVSEDAKITYERQTPIYINLNNKEKFVLNNITMRIEDYNSNLIDVKSNLCDLTILIG